MTLTDLGKAIAQTAPLLGGALGGPGGAAIGSLIAAKFGVKCNDSDALHQQIKQDPESLIKLKQIEMDHEVELQRLIIQAATDEQQLLMDDKANARQREIGANQAPKEERDKTPALLAYGLTAGVLGALAWLLVWPIPSQNQELICGIVSSLTTVWIGAMAYYHGSSVGSRLKDLHLTKMDRR